MTMTALLLSAMMQQDAYIMAEVILGEDPLAPTAIAWVIRNRSEIFGKPIRQVVTVDQFHGFRPHLRRWRSYQIERATASAIRVLTNQRQDPTGGAIYFHAVGSPTPPWAPHPRKWKKFGKHYFYR